MTDDTKKKPEEKPDLKQQAIKFKAFQHTFSQKDIKKGLDEKVLPDVRLTRSRDGSTGTATFRFKNPNILDKNTAKEGEITGMYLIDKEGILETRDVNARFVNGKPEAIESIYIMKSPEAWDRFMRFMERYGETNGLVFTKAT